MRVQICAVGRLRGGPERDLIDEYLDRFNRVGRGFGLGPVEVREIDAKKGGRHAEAQLLARAIPVGAAVIALDERGKQMSSPEFSSTIGRFRDHGRGDLTFVIGGADGLCPQFRDRADQKLSFGKMVWPHMLARVMLAEQLYRAASILAGSPYHRS